MIACYNGTLISALSKTVGEVIPYTLHPQWIGGACWGSAVSHRQPITEWSYPVSHQSPEVTQPDEDLHLQAEETQLVKVIPTVVHIMNTEKMPLILNVPS